MLEIYQEQLTDLLAPAATKLAVREDSQAGVFVEGLSQHVVESGEQQSRQQSKAWVARHGEA